jgi:phosphate starvation-inducible PhoH-like protein
VAPLAFMRGRTLNDCFVILDEAQNSTDEQMRMFLTRLGYESRTVVTGDVTQVDLPAGASCGLKEAARLLRPVDGIAFSQFTDIDVVRHPLVQRIVVAYERRDALREEGPERRPAVPRSDGTQPPGEGGHSQQPAPPSDEPPKKE